MGYENKTYHHIGNGGLTIKIGEDNSGIYLKHEMSRLGHSDESKVYISENSLKILIYQILDALDGLPAKKEYVHTADISGNYNSIGFFNEKTEEIIRDLLGYNADNKEASHNLSEEYENKTYFHTNNGGLSLHFGSDKKGHYVKANFSAYSDKSEIKVYIHQRGLYGILYQVIDAIDGLPDIEHSSKFDAAYLSDTNLFNDKIKKYVEDKLVRESVRMEVRRLLDEYKGTV